MVNVDLTNKKTLVVFWADYWGICREELPLLEANLATISENYNVIALAHSDKDSTMTWVSENLVGELEIGFYDKGRPVDQTKVRHRSIDDVKPGGLGTFFIQQIMDAVEFREGEKPWINHLVLSKKINY